MEPETKEGYVYIIRRNDSDSNCLIKVCMTEGEPYDVAKKYFGPDTYVELSLWSGDIVQTKREWKDTVELQGQKDDRGYDWFKLSHVEVRKLLFGKDNLVTNVKVDTVRGKSLTSDDREVFNGFLLFGDLIFAAIAVLCKWFCPELLENVLEPVLFDNKNNLETPIAKCLCRLLQ